MRRNQFGHNPRRAIGTIRHLLPRLPAFSLTLARGAADNFGSMAIRAQLQASKPFLGPGETRAAARVLEGGYLGSGPEARAFESELASYLGAGSHVVGVSTGTGALHLAAAALGLGPGDEVLVPSLTFVASFQAVAATGARPVACDVRMEDGLLDLQDARRRITPRTRALMPVHYAGNPGDLDAIHAFAGAHGLRVIEDAAHAFGSRSRGRLVGSFGDVACFSFDPIKNITCGQGGAVVTRDAAVAEAAARMGNLAIERVPGEGGDAIAVRSMGWRYALPDLNAAIGRVQLARFDGELKPHRVALVRRYRERLAAVRGLTMLDAPEGVVAHIFPVRIPGRRAAARAALKEEGFETLVHYKPNHRHAPFAGAPCPAADRLYEELVSLPLHGAVALDDVDAVCGILESVLGER